MSNFRDFFSNGPGTVIASIFPSDLSAERPFNGRTIYRLAGVTSQTSVNTIRIENGLERVYVGNGNYSTQPVFSDDIARDLVAEWSTGYVGQEGGVGPGVWICESGVPSQEEIADARARQTAFFEQLVNAANKHHATNNPGEINELHRKAARWLGYENVPWLEAMTQKTLKECPSCFSKVDSRAVVCPVCTRDILDAANLAVPKLRKAA